MKTNRLTIEAAALAAAALLWGCGNSGRITTVDELAAGITAAFCAWQFRCCSGVEINRLESGRYATEEECRSSSVALSTTDQLAPATNVTRAGRMTIDPAAATACIEAYRARTCMMPLSGYEVPSIDVVPDVQAILAACPGLFTGKVPIGDRCEMTAACVPGARCAGDGGTGVCRPYRKPGESCNADADCAPTGGLYCRRSDFTCAKPSAEGEPCGFSVDTPDPTPIVACAADLQCDPMSHRCVRPPGEHEPCATTFAPVCAVDPQLRLECVGVGVNGSGICIRAGQAGEACGGRALAHCAPGLVCTPTQPDGIGVCTDPPALGQRCGKEGVCGGDAICDAGSFTCEKPGKTQLGLPCAYHADCTSRFCASICLPRGGVLCVGAGTTPATGDSPIAPPDGGPIFDAGSPSFDGGLDLPLPTE